MSDKKETNVSKEEEKPIKKEKWGSKLEFILTCLSFVIGFGNIWRFPYICYANGGGAFLIPYFLSMGFIGLPLLLIEMTLGQYSAKGKVSVWTFMPIFQGIGLSMLIIVSVQTIYYNILVGWSLYYFYSSFTLEDLPWKECGHEWNSDKCRTGSVNVTIMRSSNDSFTSPSDEYFHRKVLVINDGIEHIKTMNWKIVLCVFIAWILVFLSVFKGVKSMGKVSYLTTIFPYICLIILFIRGITLKGAMDGITYYVDPTWSKLLETSVWIEASQQIFFSLSVSWGTIITLSSYNDFENHLIRDAVIIAFGNSMTSIFAGFVIFAYMGALAADRNVEVSKVATQGSGLAFIMYPEAVAKFPMGQLFAIIFFFMLILLGMGSMSPNLESILSAIFDLRPDKRKHRIIILGTICYLAFIFGLIFCTNAGMYWFTLFNGFCASTSAMIIGLTEVVAISWVYGIDKFMNHIEEMVGRKPRPQLFWVIVWKYITPLYLSIILIMSLITTTQPMYEKYEFPVWSVVLGWCINFGSVLPIPIVVIYYLIYCYSDKETSIKDVTNPEIDWKTQET